MILRFVTFKDLKILEFVEIFKYSKSLLVSFILLSPPSSTEESLDEYGTSLPSVLS